MDPYNSAKVRAGAALIIEAAKQPTAAEVAAARKAVDLNRCGYHVDEQIRKASIHAVHIAAKPVVFLSQAEVAATVKNMLSTSATVRSN